jgi:hypothetical protein
MKTIKNLTTEDIRYGIERCKARLSGVMPMGLMNTERVKDALKAYRIELQCRGCNELEFE